MKIWYQSATDFATHPNYAAALNVHAQRVLAPGTTVVFHGREGGVGGSLPMTDVIGSPIIYHAVVLQEFIAALMRAEDQGFDAFVLGSYSEPCLPELRSLARIPIVSISEATFLTAMTLAPKVGIITLSKLVLPHIEKSLALHKIDRRMTGLTLVDEWMEEETLDQQFLKPQAYLEKVREACRAAALEGAQLVVPAEGLVALISATNGLSEVDGVPLLDSIATTLLFAEFQAKLFARAAAKHSALAYRPPSPEAAAHLKTMYVQGAATAR
jgi:allantoin racemase